MSKSRLPLLPAVALLLIALLSLLSARFEPKPVEGEVVLLSNQVRDDLRGALIGVIDRAERSVDLWVYALSDRAVLSALEGAARRGVTVRVCVDAGASRGVEEFLSSSVELTYRKGAALMHQKILVIDDEEVWVGSANFTTESLRMHGNLVMGVRDKELASAIKGGDTQGAFASGEQEVAFYRLPHNDIALSRLLGHIEQAERSVRVAMFTFTHDQLTEALIRARLRGVEVTVVSDRSAGHGASARQLERLRDAGVVVALSNGNGLLHHKLCWIDEKVLVHGSANWTHSAFVKNDDIFFILNPLSSQQKSKLANLWLTIWQESL